MGWHGHGHRPIGQRHGLLAHRLIDGVEGVALREEHLVQRFPEILQQMKAVRDLGGRGRPLARALGIGGRAIACDHLHTRMLPEPLRHGLGGAIREQRHGLATLQIDQHGAIGLAFPQGEIVHPEHRGGRQRRDRQPAEQAQQRVPAHRQAPALAEAHPGLAPQGEAHVHQALGQPQGAPGPGGGHGGQPFGEDAATTVTIAAEPLADAQL